MTVGCSSDNRWFVSGAKDRALVLWDPAEGLARFKLHGHKNSGVYPCRIIDAVAMEFLIRLSSSVISVDIHGSYIATASGDMCCRICKYLSRHRVEPINGYI